MEPTLHSGNSIVLVQVFGYKPKRGDVVVVKEPSDAPTTLVKRLIALPNDIVTCRKWKRMGGEIIVEHKIPEGRVWVEGDNAVCFPLTRNFNTCVEIYSFNINSYSASFV